MWLVLLARLADFSRPRLGEGEGEREATAELKGESEESFWLRPGWREGERARDIRDGLVGLEFANESETARRRAWLCAGMKLAS